MASPINLYQYITQDEYIENGGEQLEETGDPREAEQATADYKNLLETTSAEINWLSGNTIGTDITQVPDYVDPLTGSVLMTSAIRQNYIKKATILLGSHLVDRGMKWLRGSASTSIGSNFSISQTNPQEPDYFNPAVLRHLQQAHFFSMIVTGTASADTNGPIIQPYNAIVALPTGPLSRSEVTGIVHKEIKDVLVAGNNINFVYNPNLPTTTINGEEANTFKTGQTVGDLSIEGSDLFLPTVQETDTQISQAMGVHKQVALDTLDLELVAGGTTDISNIISASGNKFKFNNGYSFIFTFTNDLGGKSVGTVNLIVGGVYNKIQLKQEVLTVSIDNHGILRYSNAGTGNNTYWNLTGIETQALGNNPVLRNYDMLPTAGNLKDLYFMKIPYSTYKNLFIKYYINDLDKTDNNRGVALLNGVLSYGISVDETIKSFDDNVSYWNANTFSDFDSFSNEYGIVYKLDDTEKTIEIGVNLTKEILFTIDVLGSQFEQYIYDVPIERGFDFKTGRFDKSFVWEITPKNLVNNNDLNGYLSSQKFHNGAFTPKLYVDTAIANIPATGGGDYSNIKFIPNIIDMTIPALNTATETGKFYSFDYDGQMCIASRQGTTLTGMYQVNVSMETGRFTIDLTRAGAFDFDDFNEFSTKPRDVTAEFPTPTWSYSDPGKENEFDFGTDMATYKPFKSNTRYRFVAHSNTGDSSTTNTMDIEMGNISVGVNGDFLSGVSGGYGVGWSNDLINGNTLYFKGLTLFEGNPAPTLKIYELND